MEARYHSKRTCPALPWVFFCSCSTHHSSSVIIQYHINKTSPLGKQNFCGCHFYLMMLKLSHSRNPTWQPKKKEYVYLKPSFSEIFVSFSRGKYLSQLHEFFSANNSVGKNTVLNSVLKFFLIDSPTVDASEIRRSPVDMFKKHTDYLYATGFHTSQVVVGISQTFPMAIHLNLKM